MGKILQISPEELFFMGKQMRAEYIDYDYVRLMKDLQQQYLLREKEIMAELVKKGFLMEDFSGNMELDWNAQEILKPVFFGNFESEVVSIENEFEGKWYKFHFHDGKIVRADIQDRQICFSTINTEELERLLFSIVPDSYRGESRQIFMDELEISKIGRKMILKNVQIREKAVCSQFLEVDGIWYVGKEENFAESLTREGMQERWNQIVKGE